MDDDTPLGMIGAALAEIRSSLGLEGIAVVDRAEPALPPAILYSAGTCPPALPRLAAALLQSHPTGLARGNGEQGEHLLARPWVLPPNRAGGLVLLRPAAAPDWSEADLAQVEVAATLLRVMLEFGPDEMGIDRLTGLPNRMYFLDEADRHIERLVQDRLTGTLMVIEIDSFDGFTRDHGHAARDWTLARIGALIRAMVRPADLVGRIGAAAFAAWLDGVDHMTAAERAEVLCGRRLTLPEAPNRGVIPIPPLSVGIASRLPDSEEDARGMLLRAREASGHARREGGGWHVARGRG